MSAEFAPVSGTAPPDYDVSGTLASINESSVLVAPTLINGFVSASEALDSGVVTTRAYSNYPSSATGTATIADADLSLATSLLTVLGVGANTITSTTTAGIGGAGLYSTGDTTIAGLTVDGTALGGLLINGSLYSDPDPNTVLLNALGIVITLNEQNTVQTATSISMFTNAIHVSLTDFLFDGALLNGDVILGHSQASVSGFVPAGGVPEPDAWLMMIVGFGLVGRAMRAHRSRGAPIAA